MAASPPSKSHAKRKCLHCGELFLPDPRNRHHQRFCAKPACRQHSKAHSQRLWLQKPENRDYFRGPENSARVRRWRAGHPDYSRRSPAEPAKEVVTPPVALQDVCPPQEPVAPPLAPLEPPLALLVPPDVFPALQDLCLSQPAVLVGLIATLTGSALQEDIAAVTRVLLRKGRDILGPHSGGAPPPSAHDQTPALSAATAARAAPV